MKFLIILTLIFIPKYLKAGSTFWVSFNGQKIILERDQQSLYSKDCKNCMAKKYLHQSITLKKTEVEFKNPSSLVCKKIDSSIIIGKLQNGHSQSFCQFKDESVLSTNSFKIEIVD